LQIYHQILQIKELKSDKQIADLSSDININKRNKIRKQIEYLSSDINEIKEIRSDKQIADLSSDINK